MPALRHRNLIFVIYFVYNILDVVICSVMGYDRSSATIQGHYKALKG